MSTAIELFITTLASGLAGAIGGVIGAWYTLWLQGQKERIKRVDHETVSVEYSAVKQDAQGYYIPGYGRLHGFGINPDTRQPITKLEDQPDIAKRNKKVALVCVERTPGASYVKYYVLHSVAPL